MVQKLHYYCVAIVTALLDLQTALTVLMLRSAAHLVSARHSY